MKLAHYDFYRLEDSGLMGDELHEAILDKNKIVIIEWAGLVAGVLPEDRLSIKINILSENSRHLEFIAGGDTSRKLLEKIK